MRLYVYVCQTATCKHVWYSEEYLQDARCPKCWDWAAHVVATLNVLKGTQTNP